jgi:serine/threonine protein kinase/predicted Zn-dependent protease
MIDKTISHYEIIDEIGRGGMGVVYKAHDTKLKRTVALKFLPQQLSADPQAKERFIHEAQAASALDHPNICTIHEIDETDDGQSYIAMACYEGQSLKDIIKSAVGATDPVAQPVSVDQSIQIAIQIAEGLQKAHEKGIVHRDIKPANIMITEDGTVKILDFGLAKLAGQTRLTKTGSTVGTAAYMSPEQARGNPIDQRTDIWSLAVILYEMVTGDLPFKGDYEQAMIYSVLNEQPEAIDRVPNGLREIIEIALAKNPQERYQEIGQLMTDLSALKEESEVSQKMVRHRQNQKKKQFKKVVKYGFYPVLAFIVLLVGYYSVQTLSSKEIEPVPIAVISFKNLTGDPTYDNLQYVIPNLLITDLEQSKFFRVNTWERMQDLLEQSGKGDLEYIDIDVGIQLCQMDGIQAIVTGTIAKIGDMFSIDVKVLDTQTKEILKSAKSVGKGVNSILGSIIDDLSLQIATAIDIPPREFVKTKRTLIDVSTDSLEAFKYYVLGRNNLDAYLFKEARENLGKAVAIDSTFAMANMYLAYAHYWVHGWVEENPVKFDLYIDRALRYRDKVTHREQLLLDYDYALLKGLDRTNSINELKNAIFLYPKEKEIFKRLAEYYRSNWELDIAISHYEKILDLDPTDRRTLNNLGYAYLEEGNYTKALESFQKCSKISPNDHNPYDSIGEVYLFMNDYTKSIEMYEKAFTISRNMFQYLQISANYIKMGDYQKAKNHINQWPDKVIAYRLRNLKNKFLAITFMGENDLENTLKEMNKIRRLVKEQKDTFSIIRYECMISEILFEHDKLEEAEKILISLPQQSKSQFWDRYLWRSTRLAIKKGDLDQAREYAEMYKREAEKKGDPYYLKIPFTFTGLIAYAESNYEKAISEFQQSNLKYSFFHYNFDVSVNRYYLALAYAKTGNNKKAVELLESVINYKDTVRIVNEIMRKHAKKQLAMLEERE